MANFIRPHTINYPPVHNTCHARDLHSNKLVEYHAEDFPQDRYEEIHDPKVLQA